MHSVRVLHCIQASQAQTGLPNQAAAPAAATHALCAPQACMLLQHMPDIQVLCVEQA
jgi:hypothetical protein